jgi:hypothetical protein
LLAPLLDFLGQFGVKAFIGLSVPEQAFTDRRHADALPVLRPNAGQRSPGFEQFIDGLVDKGQSALDAALENPIGRGGLDAVALYLPLEQFHQAGSGETMLAGVAQKLKHVLVFGAEIQQAAILIMEIFQRISPTRVAKMIRIRHCFPTWATFWGVF